MKIKDLLEGAVGYIAKNKKEASDPRYSMSVTQDIKPNEVARQAKKFGNTFPPPIIHSKAAKNSTPNKLMNLGLNEDSVSTLKTAVINQVKKTDDEKLLDRVYTVLNKTNLQDRIKDVISSETDVGKYAAVIADAIINTPGSYKEKYDFIDGYPDGYVNVDKLISGKLVNFSELITGNDFTKKVFDELFAFRPGSAGPGEFAIAALSPRIKMRSKGDLYIDNKYIEVKASAGAEVSSGGGRLGEPGLLNPNGVKEIIEKYTKKKIINDVYINQLPAILKANITDVLIIKKAATEIVKTIFGEADKDLVNAIVSGGNVQEKYVKVNWNKYKEEAGWEGLLVINRAAQSLRYFKNPEEMTGSIYGLRAIIVSKDTAKASRQILSQITLKGSGSASMPTSNNINVDAMDTDVTSTQELPKRKPADITAAKPRLKSAPKGVGRSKR
jgi:hypothetical protein